MVPAYWNQGVVELSAGDPTLKGIIERYQGEPILQRRGDAFQTLCRSILGQQISVHAASAISARFEALCKPWEPATLLRLDDEALRETGLSYSKVKYLKNVAAFFENLPEGYWEKGDYERFHRDLLAIKGVGEWTWEMFAIFYLLLPNIFPSKDLGILNSIRKLYGYDYKTSEGREALTSLKELWDPWNTVACWYLWRDLDNQPINY